MASTDLPLVLPCRGVTTANRLAADVARALVGLGAAELAGDVRSAVASGRRGRRVVALDGCESACGARQLQAEGVRARPGIDLGSLADETTDVQHLAREAARKLRDRSPSPARSRIRRPELRHAERSPRPHDLDDYLLAIDTLATTGVACGAVTDDAQILAAHVAHLLGVSRPSAGEALARLRAQGLVERGTRKEVVLTTRGRAEADRVVRRHRVLECFAVSYLGYGAHECFEHARILERGFDDDAVRRLADRLGAPERCPHGWPVDPVTAREESARLVTLPAAPPGSRMTVARVAESDAAAVRRLLELGLGPGAVVSIEDDARPGSLSFRIDGDSREVEAAAAALVYGCS